MAAKCNDHTRPCMPCHSAYHSMRCAKVSSPKVHGAEGHLQRKPQPLRLPLRCRPSLQLKLRLQLPRLPIRDCRLHAKAPCQCVQLPVSLVPNHPNAEAHNHIGRTFPDFCSDEGNAHKALYTHVRGYQNLMSQRSLLLQLQPPYCCGRPLLQPQQLRITQRRSEVVLAHRAVCELCSMISTGTGAACVTCTCHG